MKRIKVAVAAIASLGGLVAVAGASTANAATSCATATSASACGGMKALVAAAKAEGKLNVIALPPTWANYGAEIKAFEKKYGIKVNSYNPDGSSAQEISAIKADRGRPSAPDVIDVGTSFAAQNPSLLAPYKVATWKEIPAGLKDAKGRWFDDYGGYMAIGCNSAVVKTCPTSFADLLKPEYKNQVGINGDPTQASAAFSAVFAAALANGGSFKNIQPGIDFFKKLNAEGNFVPGTSGPSTIQSGATPIVIWWDYLQAGEVAASLKSWKISIPSDASYAAYYTQAISKTAPDPAAARLWEEFLYSSQGQNLWLEGSTRPVELAGLVAHHQVNKSAYAKLPAAPKNTKYPTLAELGAAANVVNQNWAAQVGGASS